MVVGRPPRGGGSAFRVVVVVVDGGPKEVGAGEVFLDVVADDEGRE